MLCKTVLHYFRGGNFPLKNSTLQIEIRFNQGWEILIELHRITAFSRILMFSCLYHLHVGWLVFEMSHVADCNESVDAGCAGLVRACKWGRGLLWMKSRLQTDVTLTRTPILFNSAPLRWDHLHHSFFYYNFFKGHLYLSSLCHSSDLFVIAILSLQGDRLQLPFFIYFWQALKTKKLHNPIHFCQAYIRTFWYLIVSV